jgi:2,4-dienoyl-CoA reductase-like NADH-dependent reductase (Old Yellow Enzyme family)
MSLLLQPVKIGVWDLPNRIVMAPLTRCRASAGRVPNTMMAQYYRQRAAVGLILAEATSISPMGVGYPDTPGLWSTEQVAGWKLVTEAVHAAGGKILAQLWHVGRISDPIYLDGRLPVAPSAVQPEGHVTLVHPRKPYVTPRALELAEIPEIIEDYRKAAQNAMEAGFDGVEIHGANGYLPHQFLNSSTNLRTDEYGGEVENRARFMLEALDAAISVWGAERVGLHLSPATGTGGDADPASSYGYVARQCSERGIAFLFVREAPDAQPRFSEGLRNAFSGTFIANQDLDRERGEALLQAGLADAVSYGRLMIANPDLVKRFRNGAPLNEPNPAGFYSSGPEGYIDYPELDTAS